MKKRAFLINFSTPIMRDVALELRRGGVEIIYWQGYRSDFEQFTKDKKNFPDTIFQRQEDAIKTKIPNELKETYFEPVNEEIARSVSMYESQALAMMGRSDYLETTFVRQRHVYYRYLKFWYNLLKILFPDVILFVNVPHGAMSYTLYALAKALRVQTLMLDNLTISTRAIVMEDYRIGPMHLKQFLAETERKDPEVGSLAPDLREHHTLQRNPAIDSTPDYTKNILHEKTFLQFPGIGKMWTHMKQGSFLRIAFYYLKMLFTKTPGADVNEEALGIVWKWRTYKKQKLTTRLREEYRSLQKTPDLKKKFIYVPLHKQPENNTCPMGGIFDDQILMLEMLASFIPDDWTIYVKENISQWSPGNREPHLYRYQGYYKDIASLRNTFVIPTEASTYDLIAGAQAVATVTGTAGWEAILRDKPALIFGYPWYQDCYGAFRITDIDTGREALQKIQKNFVPNQQQVVNFLSALDRASILAKNYKTYRYREDNPYVDRAGNVKNISEAFKKTLQM